MQDAADRESIHVRRTEHKQAKEDAAKTGHGRGTCLLFFFRQT